jgi:hypothetical protein
LLTFFLFRILFFLLYNFKFSVLLRAFSFSGYFFLMVIEGNISYFTYLFVSDFKMLYYLNYSGYALNYLTISLFFLFFIFFLSNSIIFFIIYRKKSEYLFANIKPFFKSAEFITIFMMRNILVGSINILLQDNFKNQIVCLICLEGFYFSTILIYFFPMKIFHSKIKITVTLIVSTVKITLMISLLAIKS